MSSATGVVMIDFDFITPRLAVGGAPMDYQDADQLGLAGITHDIDTTWKETDQSILASFPGISVLWNPTEDDGQEKPPWWFRDSIEFAFQALSTPHAKLYVHCDSGLNRSPSTVLAIMMALGWEYDAAMDLIHDKRPATKGWVRYATDAANAVNDLGYC